MDTQPHPRFRRRSVAFSAVAGETTGHAIVPIRSTATRTGSDVVDGHANIGATAIRTCLAIAHNDILFAERHPASKNRTHDLDQYKHFRHKVASINGADLAAGISQRFGFPRKFQLNGAFPVDETQKCVIPVEQDTGCAHTPPLKKQDLLYNPAAAHCRSGTKFSPQAFARLPFRGVASDEDFYKRYVNVILYTEKN